MTGLPPADPTSADTGAAPPSRARRRWKLGAISASAILVAAAGTVALIQHADARPTLKSAGGGLDICYRATSEADVQALAHAGLSFGVDPVELTSDGGHATVTSVTMIEPTGGVVLDRSLFLPAGGVGIGTPGDKGIDVSPPQLASMARALPATLSRTTQPPDLPPPYNTDYRDKVWQLAVWLHVPASSTRARVAGFLLTYRASGHTHTLKLTDTVTFIRDGQKC